MNHNFIIAWWSDGVASIYKPIDGSRVYCTVDEESLYNSDITFTSIEVFSVIMTVLYA